MRAALVAVSSLGRQARGWWTPHDPLNARVEPFHTVRRRKPTIPHRTYVELAAAMMKASCVRS
jgi:hypothetical protein